MDLVAARLRVLGEPMRIRLRRGEATVAHVESSRDVYLTRRIESRLSRRAAIAVARSLEPR